MPASPAPKPKNPKRWHYWVIGTALLICFALARYFVTTRPNLAKSNELEIKLAKEQLPPGSILAVHSVTMFKDETERNGTHKLAFRVRCSADTKLLSGNPACSGQIEIRIDVEYSARQVPLWESIVKYHTLSKTFSSTNFAQDIEPEPWYQSLADDPYKANPYNLEYMVLFSLTGDGLSISPKPSNRELALRSLAKSLTCLPLNMIKEATNFCTVAGRYAIISGAGHDEYEHVRKLVIAKLPPNSPDIPPPLDQYNTYRKKLGIPPLTSGSAP